MFRRPSSPNTKRCCVVPDDNVFLECAEAADAHYLITGNLRDFPERWRHTQIVTAREFLEVIAGAQRGQI
jgi:predicted nucleic acid-binding protein